MAILTEDRLDSNAVSESIDVYISHKVNQASVRPVQTNHAHSIGHGDHLNGGNRRADHGPCLKNSLRSDFDPFRAYPVAAETTNGWH